MLQRQGGGKVVVQDYVGDVADPRVAGDCDRRQRKRGFKGRVNHDEPLNRSLHQNPGVFFQQVTPAAMGCYEIEIAMADEIFTNGVQQQRTVAFADFRGKNSHSEAALLFKSSGYVVGTVVEPSSGGKDAVLGFLGDLAGPGNAVQND